MSRTQATANLTKNLESLERKDGDDWDKYKASLMSFIEELSNHDQVHSEQEK